MILEIVFLLGFSTGIITALSIYYSCFKEDDFDKRQKRYRRMF